MLKRKLFKLNFAGVGKCAKRGSPDERGNGWVGRGQRQEPGLSWDLVSFLFSLISICIFCICLKLSLSWMKIVLGTRLSLSLSKKFPQKIFAFVFGSVEARARSDVFLCLCICLLFWICAFICLCICNYLRFCYIWCCIFALCERPLFANPSLFCDDIHWKKRSWLGEGSMEFEEN